jgi:hypothetical protein
MLRVRLAPIVLAAVLGGFAAVTVPGVAQAITATSGSLAMASDAGDYIGQGLTYSYATAQGDRVESNSNGNTVSITVDGANGDWWFLDFAAPSSQPLTTGVYDGATRYPFNGAGEPGLDVSGNGRGCNMLTGSFVVTEVVLGPSNYLERFRAAFEQHCEGFEAAIRGEIAIVNPPAPAPLELRLAHDSTGTVARVDGSATVGGVLTCSQPSLAYVSGTLSQRANRFSVARGSFSLIGLFSAPPT